MREGSPVLYSFSLYKVSLPLFPHLSFLDYCCSIVSPLFFSPSLLLSSSLKNFASFLRTLLLPRLRERSVFLLSKFVSESHTDPDDVPFFFVLLRFSLIRLLLLSLSSFPRCLSPSIHLTGEEEKKGRLPKKLSSGLRSRSCNVTHCCF